MRSASAAESANALLSGLEVNIGNRRRRPGLRPGQHPARQAGSLQEACREFLRRAPPAHEVRGAGRSGRDDGPVGWRRLHRQGRNAYAVAQRVAGRRPGYGVTEEVVPLRDGATGEAGRRGQRIPSPSERTTGALGHSYKRLTEPARQVPGRRAWTSSQRSSSFPKRLATGNRTPGYFGMRWGRLGSQRPSRSCSSVTIRWPT